MYYTTIHTMSDKRLQYLILVCFHLLAVIVPLYFRFTTEELFEFNKLLVVYTITGVIFGLWLTRMVVGKTILWRRTAFDIPLLFFLATQLLATLFSIHPRTSWLGYYTRFHGGLLSYISYTILYYAAANTLERKHYKPLLITLFISGIAVSLYGILEHFGHSPSCFIITDGQQFDASCWIQDVQERVFATFGQPNWLAAYVITLIPVAGWLTVSSNAKRSERIISAIATITLFIVLLYTKSRSGFLGFAASIPVLLSFVGIWWLRHRFKSITSPQQYLSRSYSLSALAGVIGSLLFVLVVIGSPFTPALENIFSARSTPSPEVPLAPMPAQNRLDIGGTDSGEIRKIVWSGALAVWKRYPLLGSGVETFAYSYYLDRPIAHNTVSEWDFLYNKAHNELLNFLATTGILGTTAYVLLVSWFFIIVLKASSGNQISTSHYGLLVALATGIFALTISNFFGFSTVAVTLLWFLYMAMASSILSPEKEVEKQSKKTAQSQKHTQSKTEHGHVDSAQIAVTLFIWLGVFVQLIMVYRAYAADHAYAVGKATLNAGEFLPGTQLIQKAIALSPGEALYYDELAYQMAATAVTVGEAGNASAAAQLARTAVELSDTSLSLNPVHLNFYKTRARIFITLAQLNPELLHKAKETLLAAIKHAPTDPKLVYNLALVELGINNTESSRDLLIKAIALKPNYASARIELAKQYIAKNDIEAARVQLQYIIDHISPNDTQTLELLNQLATPSATKNNTRN